MFGGRVRSPNRHLLSPIGFTCQPRLRIARCDGSVAPAYPRVTMKLHSTILHSPLIHRICSCIHCFVQQCRNYHWLWRP